MCTTGTDSGREYLFCNLQSATAASAATVVSGYNGGNRYSAWGSYGATTFCCAYSGSVTGFADVKIHGSTYADTLKYSYNGTDNLGPTGVEMTASIDGDSGNDTIVGSSVANSMYLESLWGKGGEDTINGLGGDDEIGGGDDADTLLGGSGDDLMEGGGGNDTLLGGDGADMMDGEDGDDVMSGGNGNDDMDLVSPTGTDVMCGEGGDDSLKANAGTGDKLYGANVGDAVNCGASASTYYDAYSTPTGCTGTVLTSRPAECP